MQTLHRYSSILAVLTLLASMGCDAGLEDLEELANDPVEAVGATDDCLNDESCLVDVLTPFGGTLLSIYSPAPDDVWAVGDGVILHFDGELWEVVLEDPLLLFDGVHGTGPEDVWVVMSTRKTVYHWDGEDWTIHDVPFTPGGAVWAFAPDDVVVTSKSAGQSWRWDGDSWLPFISLLPGGFGYHQLWAGARDSVWMITLDGVVAQWVGTGWVDHTSPDAMVLDGDLHLSDIWGSGPSDVYVAGFSRDRGEVLFRWDGASWSEQYGDHINQVPEDGRNEFLSLAGGGPDDVWIGSCRLYHYDGVSWVHTAVEGLDGCLGVKDIEVAGPDDVWAVVGEDWSEKPTHILHFNGERWEIAHSYSR